MLLSIKDLRAKSSRIWQELPDEKEMIVTNNGLPVTILFLSEAVELYVDARILTEEREVLLRQKLQFDTPSIFRRIMLLAGSSPLLSF